jgi:hypothetical protein
VRPITPADLGQKEFKEEVDIFKSSRVTIKLDEPRSPAEVFKHPPSFSRETVGLDGWPRPLAQLQPPSPKLTENEVHMPGGVSVHPIVKTDYKGEKFGTTTTYEVRWAGGVAVCKTAEAAAEVALALSEKAAK